MVVTIASCVGGKSKVIYPLNINYSPGSQADH